jgi:hypothetical protein
MTETGPKDVQKSQTREMRSVIIKAVELFPGFP